MRDEIAETAGMIVIGEVDAHGAEALAIAAEGYAGKQADVGERAVVIVVIEVAGDGVVGDEEIGPAIVVVVGPHRAEAVVADVVVDAGFGADFFERAVAAIVVEQVAFALQSPGAALHLQAFEIAKFVAAECGELIEI